MKTVRARQAWVLAVALVVGIGLLLPAPALAKFPDKPITMICPWGPGGTTDIASRVVAKHLSKLWGVNVNVINKPAQHRHRHDVLHNAKPDGTGHDGQPGHGIPAFVVKSSLQRHGRTG
jgi:hypothetical protein